MNNLAKGSKNKSKSTSKGCIYIEREKGAQKGTIKAGVWKKKLLNDTKARRQQEMGKEERLGQQRRKGGTSSK